MVLFVFSPTIFEHLSNPFNDHFNAFANIGADLLSTLNFIGSLFDLDIKLIDIQQADKKKKKHNFQQE